MLTKSFTVKLPQLKGEQWSTQHLLRQLDGLAAAAARSQADRNGGPRGPRYGRVETPPPQSLADLLQGQKRALVATARKFLEDLEAEKRGLTPDEQGQWDRWIEELDRLNNQIEELKAE